MISVGSSLINSKKLSQTAKMSSLVISDGCKSLEKSNRILRDSMINSSNKEEEITEQSDAPSEGGEDGASPI